MSLRKAELKRTEKQAEKARKAREKEIEVKRMKDLKKGQMDTNKERQNEEQNRKKREANAARIDVRLHYFVCSVALSLLSSQSAMISKVCGSKRKADKSASFCFFEAAQENV